MVADNLERQATDKDNKGFLQKLTTARKKISLRTALIVPFVLQIFGTVSLVGYLSFNNSQNALDEVVLALRNEIGEQIELHLQDLLKSPIIINDNNYKSLNIDLLDINKPDEIAQEFWRQTQQFKDVNVIFLGNEEGGYLGVDNKNKITTTKDFKAGELLIYNSEKTGRRFGIPKLSNSNYDARLRPWYKKTKNNKRPQWSDIFTYSDGSDIAISATRPVYNNSIFKGVLAVSLSLEQISEFLRYELKIGKTGQTFILERDGRLVASSIKEKIYYKKDSKIERLNASNSSSPLINKSVEFLQKEFGNLSNIEATHQLEFDIEDKSQYLQVTPYSDDYGLDWLIVVVIPEADFMEEIHQNQQNTILLCLLPLITSIVICIITARRISQPISRLNEAVKRIT
ncbi:MAG: cache domain-containing protein, partial [Cyanobacteria bacterium J06636_27]